MKHPWMKFYPSDWRADPALRVCSLAARGLWAEMLCIMHEAEPRGLLLVNGLPVSDKQLASLAGTTTRETTAHLSALEIAGVLSRDDNGTIYSRRMCRDERMAAEGRKQIEKRWGEPNRSPNRSATEEPITQKLDTRSQIESEREERPHEIAAKEILPSLLATLKLSTSDSYGIPWQLEGLLARGFSRETILAGAAKAGPGKHWNYIVKVIESENAERSAPAKTEASRDATSTGNIKQAFRELREGRVGFGPKPAGIRPRESGNVVRLLPEGGGERSEDLCGGSSSGVG